MHIVFLRREHSDTRFADKRILHKVLLDGAITHMSKSVPFSKLRYICKKLILLSEENEIQINQSLKSYLFYHKHI